MRAWPALLLIGLLAPLAGCAGHGHVITTGTVTVLVSRGTGESMDALMPGAVKVVDGCLGVDDFVVIWPPGTTVSAGSPLTIDVPGVGELHEGSHVELGGGAIQEMPESPADLTEANLGMTVPEKCAKSSIWVAGPSQ